MSMQKFVCVKLKGNKKIKHVLEGAIQAMKPSSDSLLWKYNSLTM
jgi:hypothetical protein